MKVAVCQLPDPSVGFEEAWRGLVSHTRETKPEFLLLPELAFHTWVFSSGEFDLGEWESAVQSHLVWIERIDELGVPLVGGSRPITTEEGDRRNRAFVWAEGVLIDGHDKYYLPDEAGFWEASWYSPGNGTFERMGVGDYSAGYMTCTDMWFTEHARGYARQGSHLLLVPRATERRTRDKWIAGAMAASTMAGAFGLSSNRSGSSNGVDFAGTGWMIDPDGYVIVVTSDDEPFVTVEIDLTVADRAKTTYPRYVQE